MFVVVTMVGGRGGSTTLPVGMGGRGGSGATAHKSTS